MARALGAAEWLGESGSAWGSGAPEYPRQRGRAIVKINHDMRVFRTPYSRELHKVKCISDTNILRTACVVGLSQILIPCVPGYTPSIQGT